MRDKLKTFTDFADTLLPHETEYLMSVQRFEDKSRLEILKQVDFNCHNVHQFSPYDETLDKRKYSHLKNWIKEQLAAIDVDVHFEWMSEMERKITIDAILPDEEKQLLKAISSYTHPLFFFTKFYELAQAYRHFLLVRMRYADHKTVDKFLKDHETAYSRSKEINEQIHRATLDIVEQYQNNRTESKQWEEWLAKVFYNEDLDGQNRYLALVRLIFIGFNYRRFNTLVDKFDYLDGLFSRGIYYSKRLLLNYYSNRLLLHSKFKELDRAVYYGYLSIRAKNHDYLFYLTNLCAVLLRQDKPQEALRLIKAAAPDAKTTKSLHSKIGYVAFYIECMNKNGRFNGAEQYADTFLKAYQKEVFEYRWHIFFSAYLEAILQQKKYEKLMQVVQRFNLLEREKHYQSRANYLPTILWYNAVAEYKEGVINEKRLMETVLRFSKNGDGNRGKLPLLLELIRQLKAHVPKVINLVQDELLKQGVLTFKI